MNKKRCFEKIAYARERLADLDGWLSGEEKGKVTLLASEKAFQEIAEALMDIIAMMMSDYAYLVKDDYTNIDKLEEKKIVNENEAKVARAANGLRNRIVHHYNKIDETIFLESAQTLLPGLKGIFDRVEDYLQKQKNEKESPQ